MKTAEVAIEMVISWAVESGPLPADTFEFMSASSRGCETKEELEPPPCWEAGVVADLFTAVTAFEISSQIPKVGGVES
jgi:hypothetical protein